MGRYRHPERRADGAGDRPVYHNFSLSMDEFMAEFYATVVSEGAWIAKVPEAWKSYLGSLQPIFVHVDTTQGYWMPMYLPLAGAARGLFQYFGIHFWTNAVVSGLALGFLWSCLRQVFPEQRNGALFILALMATSPQMLVTGMSSYAMPLHLLFSLIWLDLYMRDRPWSHGLAGAVGFVATGLHQIHVHPFFAFVFCAYLLYRRRWTVSAYYLAVYAAAGLFWLYWQDIAFWLADLDVTLQATRFDVKGFGAKILWQLGTHSYFDVMSWLFNFGKLLSWQNLAILPLVLVGIWKVRSAPIIVKLALLSIVISLLPYIFFAPRQGHGWGYRYVHHLFGNFAILALFGLVWLRAHVPQPIWHRLRNGLLILGIAATLMFVPLRFFQAERFLSPFADATAHIRSLDVDVAIVDTRNIHLSADLLRNDPWLRNRPVIVSLTNAIDLRQLADICKRRSLHIVRYEELKKYGIRLWGWAERQGTIGWNFTEKHLKKAGCLR